MPERELHLYKNAHLESDQKASEAPKMPTFAQSLFDAARVRDQHRRNGRVFRSHR